MRKILTICMLFALTSAVFAGNVMKVAILEVVDKEGKLTYGQKLMLRSNLARAVTNTPGFEAYDRSDMDAIFSEHDFQRTGNVSASQIKKLGEMTGASYILVAEGALTEDKVFVTAKILNVETTKVEVTDNILLSQASAAMQRGCRTLATKMFGSLAGSSTSTNKFFSAFTKNSSGKSVEDSIAAAQKAEEMAIKEQQRKAEEQARAERAEAEKRAKEEKRLADEKARQEREAAKAKALEEKQLEKERAEAEEKRIREERAAAEEKARQERILAEERARQEREAAEEKARQEREAAVAAALERKRLDEERKAAEEAERAKYSITKVSKDEYRLGNTTMDRKAYEQFIYQNCPDAWKKHLAAKRSIITGWTFLGVGAALCSAWAMIPLADYYYEGRDDTYYITSQTLDEWYVTGIVSGSIGAALVATSIPLLSAGYSIKYNTHKTYNKSCASANKSLLSLNLQAGPNGLGLALKF